jgi:drug/metabolite transporter (DMT)-like permease
MLAAHALFTCMSVLVKQLADHVPVVELMFFRSAFALPVVALIALRGSGLAALRTRRLGGHAMRAASGTLAQFCGFFSLALLPIAEQTALNYTQPLFVTILAIPFLGEVVRIHRWSAVVVGFLGVVVIAAGRGGGFGDGAALGIGVAVTGGLFSAFTTLWQSLLMSGFALLLLPFFWVTPGAGDLVLLILVGLVGGAAQWLLTEAWASAQVSAIAPYSYSGLLWSILLGWMVFGDVPGLAMLGGSALIVVAGLYILHREMVRRREREAGAAQREDTKA